MCVCVDHVGSYSTVHCPLFYSEYYSVILVNDNGGNKYYNILKLIVQWI